jgi:diguanylate cyclase (GGDEF)-like protein
MKSSAAGVREAVARSAGQRARDLFQDRSRSARVRFGLGGLTIALGMAIAAPALARWLPIGQEGATFVIAAGVLVGLGAALGRSVDTLERRTLEDTVTCVGNRRHWEERLQVEVERANRSQMPLSVLMVDLDNLKLLNDAHGHACGDGALALVGEVLRDTCRSRDVAARFGGDEFALLLPRTRVSEARVVAERIRAELSRRCSLRVGEPVVTVSIGVADLEGVSAPRPDLLFESADCALYVAKANGRDRIEVRETTRDSGVVRLGERRSTREGRASA